MERVVGWACAECGLPGGGQSGDSDVPPGATMTALGGRWWIGARGEGEAEGEAGGDGGWIEEWEMGSAVWQVFARRGGGGGSGGMVVGGGARLGGCVFVELFEAEEEGVWG